MKTPRDHYLAFEAGYRSGVNFTPLSEPDMENSAFMSGYWRGRKDKQAALTVAMELYGYDAKVNLLRGLAL
jgi:hypothetical protein